jgi:hypothetical protein
MLVLALTLAPSIASAATCSEDGTSSVGDDGGIVGCAPYRCTPTSGGCLTLCASTSDCAAGFLCQASQCVTGAKCSEDRRSSIPTSGAAKDCSPYLCGADGECLTTCATHADCAVKGAQCLDRLCGVPTTTTPIDEKGCSYGRSSSGALFFAAVVLGLLRRRS